MNGSRTPRLAFDGIVAHPPVEKPFDARKISDFYRSFERKFCWRSPFANLLLFVAGKLLRNQFRQSFECAIGRLGGHFHSQAPHGGGGSRPDGETWHRAREFAGHVAPDRFDKSFDGRWAGECRGGASAVQKQLADNQAIGRAAGFIGDGRRQLAPDLS